MIMLKYALLGFLMYRPLSGYGLKQILDDSISNFWHADLSQIYKTLKKLEADGLISSEIEPSLGDHPDRRVYTLGAAGQAALDEWLATPPVELSPMKEPLMLRTFFAARLPPQTLVVQLHLQRELHRQQLSVYRRKDAAELERKRILLGASDADAQLWDATLRAGILYEEMYLKWLDETIEMLERQV
jgi:PadR family transcriptional regulator, regulatory protein AphA